MEQKVLTKKSFIGGRLQYPGTTVMVDEKGVAIPANSTPVGALSTEHLEAILAQRKASETPATSEPEFGKNVAEPVSANTGEQAAEFARIRPGSGDRPQVIPSGTVEHNNSFIHPASDAAPAAVEVIVAPGAADSVFDGDGDGKAGGSVPHEPVALSGKNKAQLLEIADDEGVDVPEGATNAEIVEAIEAKRADV